MKGIHKSELKKYLNNCDECLFFGTDKGHDFDRFKESKCLHSVKGCDLRKGYGFDRERGNQRKVAERKEERTGEEEYKAFFRI
jgi:hypothetical protein